MANKDKMDNAMNLDPARFQIAQSMSYMPGAPGGMMNNPMNVTSISPQPGSLSGVNQFPYGDSGLQNDQRLGGGVFPMQPSGMPQNMTRGAGYNAMVPYGQQQQPTPSMADGLEGMRLGETAMQKGLMASSMGPIGMQGMQPVPGGAMPQPQQSANTIPLQGMQSTEGVAGSGPMMSGMNPMNGPTGPEGAPMAPDAGQNVPGSTPTKKGRNPRGKK